MEPLQGYWFDGRTSAGLAAQMQLAGDGKVWVRKAGEQNLLCASDFRAIRISSRIGSTPRYLYFSGGEKFETANNDLVDQWLEQHRPSLFNTLAYQLESHTYVAGVALALLLVLSWAGVQYGLPAASKAIAYRLPQDVMQRAAAETLKILDKTHLGPSRLAPLEQDRVLAHFSGALHQYGDLQLRVLFREGGELGANAIALPDGTILFTDEMVRLAQSDDELLAVLAHEIGHIKYRHSLRSAIQGTSIGFMVSMLTGDLSAASGILTTLPVILTTMSYSRDFEREADQNALDYLTEHNLDPSNFVRLMERLTYEAHCNNLLKLSELGQELNHHLAEHSTAAGERPAPEAPPVREDAALAKQPSAARKALCDKLIAKYKSDESGLMGYFSTHPDTAERLQKFRRAN